MPNYFRLTRQARALAYFAFKEEKKGNKIDYNSFENKFGKKITDSALRDILSQNPSVLEKRGEFYVLSKDATNLLNLQWENIALISRSKIV